MSLIQAYKNRGRTINIVIQDVNSNAIIPGVNDEVRVSIGRQRETPKFTVTSGSPTPAGSSIIKGASNSLRLDASDLDFEAGVYTLFVDYFDNADAQEWKNVDRQVFHLVEDYG